MYVWFLWHYIFNPTLNIKMVFVEKIPNMGTQSVTCLATLKSDCNPGIASSIPARSNAFVEIDHEIISTVILLPSAESFKKGCCQLQVKVCYWLTSCSSLTIKCG